MDDDYNVSLVKWITDAVSYFALKRLEQFKANNTLDINSGLVTATNWIVRNSEYGEFASKLLDENFTDNECLKALFKTDSCFYHRNILICLTTKVCVCNEGYFQYVGEERFTEYEGVLFLLKRMESLFEDNASYTKLVDYMWHLTFMMFLVNIRRKNGVKDALSLVPDDCLNQELYCETIKKNVSNSFQYVSSMINCIEIFHLDLDRPFLVKIGQKCVIVKELCKACGNCSDKDHVPDEISVSSPKKRKNSARKSFPARKFLKTLPVVNSDIALEKREIVVEKISQVPSQDIQTIVENNLLLKENGDVTVLESNSVMDGETSSMEISTTMNDINPEITSTPIETLADKSDQSLNENAQRDLNLRIKTLHVALAPINVIRSDEKINNINANQEPVTSNYTFKKPELFKSKNAAGINNVESNQESVNLKYKFKKPEKSKKSPINVISSDQRINNVNSDQELVTSKKPELSLPKTATHLKKYSFGTTKAPSDNCNKESAIANTVSENQKKQVKSNNDRESLRKNSTEMNEAPKVLPVAEQVNSEMVEQSKSETVPDAFENENEGNHSAIKFQKKSPKKKEVPVKIVKPVANSARHHNNYDLESIGTISGMSYNCTDVTRGKSRRKWTLHQDFAIILGVDKFGLGKWHSIQQHGIFKKTDVTPVKIKDRWRTMVNNKLVELDQYGQIVCLDSCFKCFSAENEQNSRDPPFNVDSKPGNSSARSNKHKSKLSCKESSGNGNHRSTRSNHNNTSANHSNTSANHRNANHSNTSRNHNNTSANHSNTSANHRNANHSNTSRNHSNTSANRTENRSNDRRHEISSNHRSPERHLLPPQPFTKSQPRINGQKVTKVYEQLLKGRENVQLPTYSRMGKQHFRSVIFDDSDSD